MSFNMVSVLMFPETHLIIIDSAKINGFRKLGLAVPLSTVLVYMTSSTIEYQKFIKLHTIRPAWAASMVIYTVGNTIKNRFSFKKQIWIRAVFKEFLSNLVSCTVFFRRIFIKAKFKIGERAIEILPYIVWVSAMLKQELNCSKVVVSYGFA